MLSRFAALSAALPLALACATSTPPAHAQTKPKNKVDADRTEARAIIKQLVREGRIMRSSQVKRGMRGVARSVFQGTKIEEFRSSSWATWSASRAGPTSSSSRCWEGPSSSASRASSPA